MVEVLRMFELSFSVGKALMAEWLRTAGLKGLYVDDLQLLIDLAGKVEDPVVRGFVFGVLAATREAVLDFMQRCVPPTSPGVLH